MNRRETNSSEHLSAWEYNFLDVLVTGMTGLIRPLVAILIWMLFEIVEGNIQQNTFHYNIADKWNSFLVFNSSNMLEKYR